MSNTQIADPKTSRKSKGKGGAPQGNRNATRHGLRASSLPPGCLYLQSQLTAFRRYIRDELVARDSRPTTTYQEAILQSAVRHETRAVLAGRWLRKEAAKLTIEQRISLTREIGNATDARDRCLKMLGLDQDARQGAIDALYTTEPTPDNTDDNRPTSLSNGGLGPNPCNVSMSTNKPLHNKLQDDGGEDSE